MQIVGSRSPASTQDSTEEELETEEEAHFYVNTYTQSYFWTNNGLIYEARGEKQCRFFERSIKKKKKKNTSADVNYIHILHILKRVSTML